MLASRTKDSLMISLVYILFACPFEDLRLDVHQEGVGGPLAQDHYLVHWVILRKGSLLFMVATTLC